jgi:predicted Zn-dependent protease
LAAARKSYERSLELNPANRICRHSLAITLLRLEDFEACVRLLRDHVEEHPDDLNNLLNLSLALLTLDRCEEAEPLFERLAGQPPEDPRPRETLAQCQWKLGKESQAKENLKKARDLEEARIAKQPEAADHSIVRQVERMIEQEPSDSEN